MRYLLVNWVLTALGFLAVAHLVTGFRVSVYQELLAGSGGAASAPLAGAGSGEASGRRWAHGRMARRRVPAPSLQAIRWYPPLNHVGDGGATPSIRTRMPGGIAIS